MRARRSRAAAARAVGDGGGDGGVRALGHERAERPALRLLQVAAPATLALRLDAHRGRARSALLRDAAPRKQMYWMSGSDRSSAGAALLESCCAISRRKTTRREPSDAACTTSNDDARL